MPAVPASNFPFFLSLVKRDAQKFKTLSKNDQKINWMRARQKSRVWKRTGLSRVGERCEKTPSRFKPLLVSGSFYRWLVFGTLFTLLPRVAGSAPWRADTPGQCLAPPRVHVGPPLPCHDGSCGLAPGAFKGASPVAGEAAADGATYGVVLQQNGSLCGIASGVVVSWCFALWPRFPTESFGGSKRKQT